MKIKNDSNDQVYRNMNDSSIINNDIFVIGRAIYNADKPLKEIIEYHKIINI